MDSTNLIAFHNCCTIITMIDCKPNSFINYAKSYANVGLRLTDLAKIKFQIPYLLSNLKYWRGEEAKLVKLKLQKLLKRI